MEKIIALFCALLLPALIVLLFIKIWKYIKAAKIQWIIYTIAGLFILITVAIFVYIIRTIPHY
jgi:hypothetical protein